MCLQVAIVFDIAIKDYFKMKEGVKHLIWRIIMRNVRARQIQLNESLSWDDEPFSINEVLQVTINEYETTEEYEAVQACIDAAKYYDIELY